MKTIQLCVGLECSLEPSSKGWKHCCAHLRGHLPEKQELDSSNSPTLSFTPTWQRCRGLRIVFFLWAEHVQREGAAQEAPRQEAAMGAPRSVGLSGQWCHLCAEDPKSCRPTPKLSTGLGRALPIGAGLLRVEKYRHEQSLSERPSGWR